MLKVAPSTLRSELVYICPIPGELPDHFPPQFHGFARAATAVWKRSR